jgi:hypothetical protein
LENNLEVSNWEEIGYQREGEGGERKIRGWEEDRKRGGKITDTYHHATVGQSTNVSPHYLKLVSLDYYELKLRQR